MRRVPPDGAALCGRLQLENAAHLFLPETFRFKVNYDIIIVFSLFIYIYIYISFHSYCPPPVYFLPPPPPPPPPRAFKVRWVSGCHHLPPMVLPPPAIMNRFNSFRLSFCLFSLLFLFLSSGFCLNRFFTVCFALASGGGNGTKMIFLRWFFLRLLVPCDRFGPIQSNCSNRSEQQFFLSVLSIHWKSFEIPFFFLLLFFFFFFFFFYFFFFWFFGALFITHSDEACLYYDYDYDYYGAAAVAPFLPGLCSLIL